MCFAYSQTNVLFWLKEMQELHTPRRSIFPQRMKLFCFVRYICNIYINIYIYILPNAAILTWTTNVSQFCLWKRPCVHRCWSAYLAERKSKTNIFVTEEPTTPIDTCLHIQCLYWYRRNKYEVHSVFKTKLYFTCFLIARAKQIGHVNARHIRPNRLLCMCYSYFCMDQQICHITRILLYWVSYV